MWYVEIEEMTGEKTVVAEGFTDRKSAEAYAAEIEAREEFWAEAREAK